MFNDSKRTYKNLKIIIWSVILTFNALSFRVHAETFNLKIASGHNTGWLFVKIAKEYFEPEIIKRVKERTGHDVVFTEGYAGAMVKAPEVLEGVESGIIDIGVFCICHEGQKLALHNFMMYLPFGPTDPVTSIKATRKVYDQIPEMYDIIEKKYKQKQLALIPFDPYIMISRVPVNGPEEMNGLKVGAAGPNLFWAQDVGGRPLSVAGPDVYTSFQSGLMDLNITFMSIMDPLKLYSVAPYLIKVGFGTMSTPAIHMNLKRLNSLPKDVQDIIIEVGKDTEAYAGPATQKAMDENEVLIVKNGAKVSELSADAKRRWAEAVKDSPVQLTKDLENRLNIPMRDAMRAYIKATKDLGYEWPLTYNLE